MKRKLYPHQKKALAWASSRNKIALFKEMRLGKSLVAIRWVQLAETPIKALVIAPLSVLHVWESELHKENVEIAHIRTMTGTPHQRAKVLKSLPYGWILTNYEAIRTTPEVFKIPWTHVILDESTKIRSAKAQITKLLTSKFQHIPHKAILSGLPAPESSMDYFTQMQFLHGEFLNKSNFWHFRQAYYYQVGYEWIPKRGTEQRIRTEVAAKAFCLTRKEANMGSKKVYEKRLIPMSLIQKSLTKQITKDFCCEELTTKWTPVKFSWLGRVAGGFTPEGKLISDSKINEIIELMQNQLRQEQVVIWFRFNYEIKVTVDALRKKGFKTNSMTGATPKPIRTEYVNSFRENKFQIFCVQTKCSPFGMDFSSASTAIYYSNWYDYELRAQSEDRILHPAKKEPLLYIDLVTKNSIDEHALELLQTKKLRTKGFLIKLKERIKR
ncbi:MAG: DEAD/DEAH box helicase [Candidatus Omnitrophota bacterium]